MNSISYEQLQKLMELNTMDRDKKIRVINRTTGETFEATMEELMMIFNTQIRENCSEEEDKE